MGSCRQILQRTAKNLLQIQTTFHTKSIPGRIICTNTEATNPEMDLNQVVKKVQNLAPTSLAESWDNVGLLVEPTPPHTVNSIFLTNDLTEPVMQEALDKKANMILCYHPPIFVPLKRLTQRTWKERVILKCVENRIALYSPHTSYDAVKDGLSDWLISPFVGRTEPVQQTMDSSFPTLGKHHVEFLLGPDILGHVVALNGVDVTVGQSTAGDETLQRVQCCCTDKGLVRLMETLQPYQDVRETLQITALNKPPLPGHGMGRTCKLKTATTLGKAVAVVKDHLGLKMLRLAKGNGCSEDSKVKAVAVCAGSGGQILHGVDADLYITGEMSHHEVLDATGRGTSVILCDHSNTERGYLKVLQKKLLELFENKIDVNVSEIDADPLQIV